MTTPPFSASTPEKVLGDLIKVELIEKDNKRFPDTHGWGYAVFDYDASSGFNRLRKNSCFVSGHDFSRAAQAEKMKGFSPCYGNLFGK